jgi:hypothetical protein
MAATMTATMTSTEHTVSTEDSAIMASTVGIIVHWLMMGIIVHWLVMGINEVCLLAHVSLGRVVAWRRHVPLGCVGAGGRHVLALGRVLAWGVLVATWGRERHSLLFILIIIQI